MPTRRQLLSFSVAALCGALTQPAFAQYSAPAPKPPHPPTHAPKAAAPPPAINAANDPLAITNAIYTRVTAGKGDEGGQFVWLEKKDRPRYLSKSLTALWNKADSKVAKGDAGPPGFDPITNSQDPLVKSFGAKAETQDDASATIAVTIQSGHTGPPQPTVADTIRFDFVRDGTQWKIDNIRGTVDGSRWSIRRLLVNSMN